MPRRIYIEITIPSYLTARPSRDIVQAARQQLRMWDSSGGGRAGVKNVFSNQALNTLYNYGARGTEYVAQLIVRDYKSYPFSNKCRQKIIAIPADQTSTMQDVYVTDPPY